MFYTIARLVSFHVTLVSDVTVGAIERFVPYPHFCFVDSRHLLGTDVNVLVGELMT